MSDESLAQYQAVRGAVGLIELADRGKVRATGPDRVAFLHSMISNDVERLEDFAGCYATFLTAKGKIVADFYCYRLPDSLLLDLPQAMLPNTVETLQKYIIMDDVELQDESRAWAHFSLQGPRSDELVTELTGAQPPAQRLRVVAGTFRGHSVYVVSKAELAEKGFEVLLPSELGEPFAQEALEHGRNKALLRVGPQARELLRIEAGIPAPGIEIDETRYPMEARLDEALSFDKGCYIGQEVVAKATYIGGVARLLVRLMFEGSEVPPPGADLVSQQGKRVGKITSSAFSPALRHPIALGYVKRASAQPGLTLRADLGQHHMPAAKVVESFL